MVNRMATGLEGLGGSVKTWPVAVLHISRPPLALGNQLTYLQMVVRVRHFDEIALNDVSGHVASRGVMFYWEEHRCLRSYFRNADEVGDFSEHAPAIIRVQNDYEVYVISGEQDSFLPYPIWSGFVYAPLREKRAMSQIRERVANLVTLSGSSVPYLFEVRTEYGYAERQLRKLPVRLRRRAFRECVVGVIHPS